MPNADHITSTAQTFLDIFDITNDLVIMRDGAVSLIMNVNAINFGLFAEEEQDAVIYAYAGLLNSLNFPLQIVVKSQTKDVTSYLALLRDQEEQTTSELKRGQIKRYREFVNNLIKERNVLDKKFYVVVTATPLEMGFYTPQTVLPGVKPVDISTMERSVILEKATDLLEPRRDHLTSQFARIGLFAQQLATQDIIQLFYTSYNPEATEGQQVADTSSYTSPVVSAQFQPNAESVIASFAQPEKAAETVAAVEAQAQAEETHAAEPAPVAPAQNFDTPQPVAPEPAIHQPSVTVAPPVQTELAPPQPVLSEPQLEAQPPAAPEAVVPMAEVAPAAQPTENSGVSLPVMEAAPQPQTQVVYQASAAPEPPVPAPPAVEPPLVDQAAPAATTLPPIAEIT